MSVSDWLRVRPGAAHPPAGDTSPVAPVQATGDSAVRAEDAWGVGRPAAAEEVSSLTPPEVLSAAPPEPTPAPAPAAPAAARVSVTAATAPAPAAKRRLPYVPRRERDRRPLYTLGTDRLRGVTGPNGQVLPPPNLRPVAWQFDDAAYLRSGAESARTVRELAEGWGAPIAPGARILDWGCGACRVLRHFHAEAELGACWGVDMRETLIAWNQKHLAPPFRFATISEYPHLGFEDNYFDLVLGLGVFSRLEHLLDLWLLELRRILRPGGVGVFTVLSEASLTYFAEFGAPEWLPDPDAIREIAREVDVAVIKEGGGPYVFYRRAYLAKHCKSFFAKVHFNPLVFDDYYSALVVQK